MGNLFTIQHTSDMRGVEGFSRVRCAVRENQQIVVVNKGPRERGFQVCADCGAAMPGEDERALLHVGRPYRSYLNAGKCSHGDVRFVDLGFDFVTDMLVMEILLDDRRIDTQRGSLWLRRAAQTLAEAIRLEICKKLDIEFTELATGYRLRNLIAATAVDIYVYDNLSSGAGYSAAVQDSLVKVLEGVRARLSSCDCEGACYNCLKHYRNQSVHSLLDRCAALQLLEWGKMGRLPFSLGHEVQRRLIASLEEILAFRNISIVDSGEHLLLRAGEKEIGLQIIPGMINVPDKMGWIFLSDVSLKYDRPFALEKICSHFR